MSDLKIYPSLLAADIGHLYDGVKLAETSGADGLHLDIMDGHFVPNISMGPSLVRMARKATDLHLDVHLMMSRPQDLLDDFINAGSDTILIHTEAECDCRALLSHIRDAGRRCGITINPDTPPEAVEPFLDICHEVLVMSVHPGFGGQSFILESLDKLQVIRDLITTKGADIDLEIDGGINAETAGQSVQAGANILVAGTWLYGAEDMKREMNDFRASVRSS